MHPKTVIDKLFNICRASKNAINSLLHSNKMLETRIVKIEQKNSKIENELERLHKMFENLLVEQYETKKSIQKLVNVTEALTNEQNLFKKEKREFENRIASVKHESFMKGATTWPALTSMCP